jgi:uncharacterized membrane protein YgcG
MRALPPPTLADHPTLPYKLLQVALVGSGAACISLYPLALVWPSGWAWHHGAPQDSLYFMMIVGIYAALGVFLLNAARRPEANVSLIWFTVVSSVVHAGIMAAQSFGPGHHMGHLAGDVPALLVMAVALAVLVVKAGVGRQDCRAVSAGSVMPLITRDSHQGGGGGASTGGGGGGGAGSVIGGSPGTLMTLTSGGGASAGGGASGRVGGG